MAPLKHRDAALGGQQNTGRALHRVHGTLGAVERGESQSRQNLVLGDRTGPSGEGHRGIGLTGCAHLDRGMLGASVRPLLFGSGLEERTRLPAHQHQRPGHNLKDVTSLSRSMASCFFPLRMRCSISW